MKHTQVVDFNKYVNYS